jgi:hypothetical protein
MDEGALAAARNDLLGEKANEMVDNQFKTSVPAKEQESRPRGQGGSFSEYLKQQPVAPEVADLGKRPSKSTWRIEVWNGDRKDVHEVELEEEPVETPPTAPTLGNQWTAPLMRFFTRKKSEPLMIEETQNDAADDVRSNSYKEKSATGPLKTVRQ